MMEERLTTLESKSDSNAAALAALENDMNDRFNRIETELSEGEVFWLERRHFPDPAPKGSR